MTDLKNRHTDYVELMLNAATQARTYTDGLSKADFLDDAKTQDAVIMKLLVIGELAARLLEEHQEFTCKHPEIPWQKMKGMRNRMAHGYFDLNMDVVWDTAQLALPDLETNLRAIEG